MQLAFLYNVRHSTPDPESQAFHLDVDLDDQKTIDLMVKHLRSLGHTVTPVEANEEAYQKLFSMRQTIDLVFNYSLGLHGESGYAQLPAMCEMLQIPYTGSGVLTQALVMNKAKMYEVLSAYGIKTPKTQLVLVGQDVHLDTGFEYPLMVKPVARGSSAGITQSSLVSTSQELHQQINFIWETFKEPALVQTFLPGREFSLGLLGNPPVALPLIEPVFSKLPEGYLPFDSLEVKWIFEEEAEEIHLTCPALLSAKRTTEIIALGGKVWQVLGMRDYCRIDIRCDKEGVAYVLDVNSPAGLIPPEISDSSYLPMAARAQGIGYDQLLNTIIEAAEKRYDIKSGIQEADDN